jgi:hypothetical protein
VDTSELFANPWEEEFYKKNPMTKNLISSEELSLFKEMLGEIPQGDPYALLISILKKITDLQFPESPADVRLQADWELMFRIWFFETMPNIQNANWTSNTKTIFNYTSLYSADIVNSVSFSDLYNERCIKNQFFKYTDDKRPNPVKVSFSFVGGDTGLKNYYSWVEWFIGSYSTYINWMKRQDGSYDIWAKINNTSSWYSGTRLPKSWQNKIKKETGYEILNLVDSAPRSETVKRKLSPLVIKTLEYMGLNIPSFGGNWEQEFYVKTNWKLPNEP